MDSTKQIADLPIAEIRRLARQLKEKGKTLALRSNLVAIQPNGTRPPLFLNHPAGAALYQELSNQLGTDQPVYGLEEIGFENIKDDYTPVEQTAATYIEALQKVQPSGPYFLGGYSFGGVVAFEMAQQLTSKGEQVALLILIDTPAPAGADSSDIPAQKDHTASSTLGVLQNQLGDLLKIAGPDELRRRLGIYLGLDLALPTENLQTMNLKEQEDYILHELKARHVLDVDGGYLQHLARVVGGHFRALRNYVPRNSAQRILLLRSVEGHPYPEFEELVQPRSDATLGWQKYTNEPVVVETVPGNHFSVMDRSRVSLIANIFNTHLNKIYNFSEKAIVP